MISYPNGPFFIAFLDKDMSPYSWSPEYSLQCEAHLGSNIPDPFDTNNHNKLFHWKEGRYSRCAIIEGPHIGIGESKGQETATKRAYAALNSAKTIRKVYMGEVK